MEKETDFNFERRKTGELTLMSSYGSEVDGRFYTLV